MSLFGSYKEKKTFIAKKSLQKEVFKNDRIRFSLIVFVFILVLVVYALENSVFICPNVSFDLSKEASWVGRLYDIDEYQEIYETNNDCGFKYMTANFDFIEDDDYVSLGRYDSEKDGYFGLFADSESFEVFLPHMFSGSTFFAKNGVALFINSIGYDESKVEPMLCHQRLIYDEIYPATMYMRMFNEGGIKDYILLKDDSAPTKFGFLLNYHGGEIRLAPTGDVIFYNDQGEEKFKIDRMIGYDSDHQRIDHLISYDLIDNHTLELEFDGDYVSYPVLLDPSISNL